ncbi:ABC transporter permease [Paenibacillus sp. GSMTC-2017]|uniref:ABC transporter permease n=1 Tax=Paenibacillus sp. GSMTC-2017 TaxID=2794350 RepID=UPI0018D8A262|nr:ABC transporter permease [Paenibacillus sp. GSMTC-2017]MBH5317038.1 ABC transporter permease [Paenibacillus sp. GSMTC-2017]
MLKFSGLLTNEWLKMYKKKSFFIFFGIMALYVAITTYVGHRWLEDNTALTFTNFFISLSTAGQLLPIIAIIAVASIVPQEFQMGTIKQLLIRSHSRNKILASKYITALFFSAALILTTLGLLLIGGTIAYGFGGDTAVWRDIAQNVMYLTIYTFTYVTVTFMISVLTKSIGATIGITMFSTMIGGLFTLLMSKYTFLKFTLFPHVDLSPYRDGGVIMEGMSLTFSASVIGVYIVISLLASFVTFRKRDVS